MGNKYTKLAHSEAEIARLNVDNTIDRKLLANTNRVVETVTRHIAELSKNGKTKLKIWLYCDQSNNLIMFVDGEIWLNTRKCDVSTMVTMLSRDGFNCREFSKVMTIKWQQSV